MQPKNLRGAQVLYKVSTGSRLVPCVDARNDRRQVSATAKREVAHLYEADFSQPWASGQHIAAFASGRRSNGHGIRIKDTSRGAAKMQ